MPVWQELSQRLNKYFMSSEGFISLSPPVTLKIRSISPKLISTSTCHSDISMQVLRKSTHELVQKIFYLQDYDFENEDKFNKN